MIKMFRRYGFIGCLDAVADGWLRRHPGYACYWFIGVHDGMLGRSSWTSTDDETPAWWHGFRLGNRIAEELH